VPSAVVPAEGNVLVNPRHRAFGEVQPYGPVELEIDERQQ
jgi:hypothetical protein